MECFSIEEILISCLFFQFSLSGSHPYHKSCHKELHHPKCDVCHQFVRTSFLGVCIYIFPKNMPLPSKFLLLSISLCIR